MRVAVFSDVHGNAVALDVVLAEIARERPDAIVCLGDCVQGGPQPAETVARLRALACPVVMGNADSWLLTGVSAVPHTSDAALQRMLDDVRAWSLAQLNEADRDYVRAFAPTVRVPLEGGGELLGFHGSPDSFDQILLPTTPEAEFRAALAPHTARLHCGGHTHLPHQRRSHELLFFNPGSVGVAYTPHQDAAAFRLDAWAEYAMVTVRGAGLAIEFRRRPYDVARLLEAYRSSGRPHAERAIREYGG